MSPQIPPKSRLNLCMDPGLKTALLDAAVTNRSTASKIITQALNQYLKRRKSRSQKPLRSLEKEDGSNP